MQAGHSGGYHARHDNSFQLGLALGCDSISGHIVDRLFPGARRSPYGIDEDGVPILCDPDGKRWAAARPLRE